MVGLLTKSKIVNFRNKVRGRKKVTYLLILLALAEGNHANKVADAFHYSEGNISKIAKANKELLDELTLQADLSNKAGRLRKAYQIINKKNDSKKDLLDWLDYVRKEQIDSEKASTEDWLKADIEFVYDRPAPPKINNFIS